MAQAQDRPLPRDFWSWNPEDVAPTGRNNVDAEIIKARFAPDHYPGKTKHFCFFRVSYRDLDTGEEFVEKYRMGFFNQIVPTNSSTDLPKEEREPAGGDDATYHALGRGDVQLEPHEIEEYEGTLIMGAPEPGTDFLIWLRALVEAGFEVQGEGSLQFEGVQVHLDRGKGATYKDKESGEEKAGTILLPAAILKNPNAGAKKSNKPATTANKAATKPASTTLASGSAKAASKSNGSAALDTAAEAFREIIETNGENGEIDKGSALTLFTRRQEFKTMSGADRKAFTDSFNDDSFFTMARGLLYDSEQDVIRAL